MYGYELVQMVEQESGGLLTIQDGTLYPVLYRLSEQGYIADRSVPAGKRMMRIYYRLTEAGEAYLRRICDEYAQVSEGARRILSKLTVCHETA